MTTLRTAALCAGLLITAGGAAQAQVEVRHIQTAASPIAAAVWAGDTLYLSGQLADPVSPAAGGQPAVYGDTHAQAASIFAKIQKALQAQGLGMKDVVKMTVFLTADPATGKLDFEGLQTAFKTYFGTAEQPNKPARSAVQVAALVAPWARLEIEAIAVKGR